MRFSREQALDELPEALKTLLEREVTVQTSAAEPNLDVIVTAGQHTFLVAIRNSGNLGPVVGAIEELKDSKVPLRQPMLVVPYMTSAGRAYCRDRCVSWLDLSGNARVQAPGLLVKASGQPNRFRSQPTDISAFAPKSSRIVRQLLMAPQRSYKQKELVEITGLQQGLVSRLVSRLKTAGFLEQDTRLVHLIRPRELLDTWHEVYDFQKHSLLRGHISAQSAPAILEGVSTQFRRSGLEHAATGLAGAWLRTHYADFRLATLYVKRQPTKTELAEIGFRHTDRGSNIWLVLPNDEGVFAGSREREAIPCVHPVQNYLDLKGHPERATDAAEELRTNLLPWLDNG